MYQPLLSRKFQSRLGTISSDTTLLRLSYEITVRNRGTVIPLPYLSGDSSEPAGQIVLHLAAAGRERLARGGEGRAARN